MSAPGCAFSLVRRYVRGILCLYMLCYAGLWQLLVGGRRDLHQLNVGAGVWLFARKTVCEGYSMSVYAVLCWVVAAVGRWSERSASVECRWPGIGFRS